MWITQHGRMTKLDSDIFLNITFLDVDSEESNMIQHWAISITVSSWAQFIRNPGLSLPDRPQIPPWQNTRLIQYLSQWHDQPGGAADSSYCLSCVSASQSLRTKWRLSRAPSRQSLILVWIDKNKKFKHWVLQSNFLCLNKQTLSSTLGK